MKKFKKLVFGTLSVATLAAGAYYLYKNFIQNDASDDFDDFEDDFEDFEDFEDDFDIEGEEPDGDIESREYVSINITSEEEEAPAVSEDAE